MTAMDVLLCTYERPDHVVRAVADVVPQLGPEDRVLVLDQSARVQPTGEALAALGDPRVRHLAAPPRGLPVARNRALAETCAPLVVFLDDDVRLHPGCLDAHREALQQPGIGATVGSVEEVGLAWNARHTRNEVDRAGRVRVRLEGGEAVDVGSVKGCNMGFRRLALRQAGGFDPGFAGTAFLEETDVSERLRAAGWRVRFVPEASLVHLSAPAGGVRQGTAERTAYWRFHNTGRFLRKNRGPGAALLAAPVFAAIAARRAVEWGSPVAIPRLMAAYALGVTRARRPPQT